MCYLAGRNRGRSIDGVVGGSIRRYGKRRTVALEVEDRVLKEAEMAFAMSPGARNGHEVGGEFLFQNF